MQAYVGLVNIAGFNEKEFNELEKLALNIKDERLKVCVLTNIYECSNQKEKAFKINREFFSKHPLYYEEYLDYLRKAGGKEEEINRVLEGVKSSDISLNLLYYGFMGVKLYEEGKYDLADKYFLMVEEGMKFKYILLENKLKKIVRYISKRDIPVIIMQYPLRSIEVLKNILKDEEGKIYFVENRENFREALKKYKYEDIFSDQFAGDFGHLTHKMGVYIMADNLADVLINKLWKD